MSYRHVPSMPWGKYKSQSIDRIPGSYLFWVVEECTRVDHELHASILAELASRLPRPPVPMQRNVVDRDYLVAWCRRAALACHPDHGGSVDAMKLVNELRGRVA